MNFEDPLFLFLVGIALVVLFFRYFLAQKDQQKRGRGTWFVLAITVLSIFTVIPPDERLKKGLDIAGGTAFTLKIQPKPDSVITKETVDYTIDVINKRLNSLGTSDIVIQHQGVDTIVVKVPGASEEESNRITEILSKTAKLEMKGVHRQSDILAQAVQDGTQFIPNYQVYPLSRDGGPAIPMLLAYRNTLTGMHIANAQPNQAVPGNLDIELTSEGAKMMKALTKPMEAGQDRIAIVLDDQVMSAPTLQQDSLGKNFQITGMGTYDDASKLATALNNPLENSLLIEEKRQVSPTLGAATVKQGIIAGTAGLGLTLLFMLLYYRLAGVVALIGLTLNILILFGSMSILGFNFTLTGIAGIILTIGVAVDANVLIYERLREELKLGYKLRVAVKRAYQKAFSAIIDANITTLLIAFVLFARAGDFVKGFAVTLTLGIIASLISALIATRVCFAWFPESIKSIKFLSISPKKQFNFIKQRSKSLVISAILILASVFVVFVQKDTELGVDFTGGTLIEFQLGEKKLTKSAVQTSIDKMSLSSSPVVEMLNSPATGSLLSIRCAIDDTDNLVSELRAAHPVLAADSVELSQNQVSPTLGKQVLKQSIIALAIGLVLIFIYITLRFEFSFAIAACIALFHDLLIVLGWVVLVSGELTLIHVGAFLTIAGYSINDTIVVFDRVREQLKVTETKASLATIFNAAINATLSRTILTSATTFIAVLVLFIFGGSALQDFSFAILAGVVVGTYSSIWVASPVVYLLARKNASALQQEIKVADDEGVETV